MKLLKKLSPQTTFILGIILFIVLAIGVALEIKHLLIVPPLLAGVVLTTFFYVLVFAPSLTYRIFLGMIIGIFIGYYFPNKLIVIGHISIETKNLSELGHIFLNLIKMIIAPLVLSTIIVGIAKLGDFKTVGRIGAKTIGYFMFASILSLILGLLLVNFFQPGVVMHMDLPAAGTETGIQGKLQSFADFVDHVFPKSLIEAMTKNEILSILVFSIFFGIATAAIGEQGKVVVKAMDSISHVMLKLTGYVMNFAPYGVLGSLAVLVSKIGLQKLLVVYPFLIAIFYLGLIIFTFGVLYIIASIGGIPFFKLFKAVKEPFILAFSTASSESAMPKVIEALEKFGCSNRIVSFVLPLGYSFNLDGSMMNMTFATMFIAQSYGMHLGWQQQVFMMLILMITSKGIAGVPRASLVVVTAILPTFNIPVEGIALLLGIDQILDMGRSATNVMGNAVATALVSKWEGELKMVEN